jgi:hypothetical protein
VLVGAVEEQGDEGADLVAQGGLGGGEGWLGDELVVLCAWLIGFMVSLGCVWVCRAVGVGGREGKHTRTVLRTEVRRGKSCTPVPRVATEDSRKEREVRRDETQSP